MDLSTSPPPDTGAPPSAAAASPPRRPPAPRCGACSKAKPAGSPPNPNQTVADYLTTWLQAKAYVLKPTTLVRYRDYVTHDLIPALGTLKLDELGHRHIAGFAHTELEHGRGPVTVHRCLATLSSALGDAVRQHRLAHNPARRTPHAARRTIIPRPAAPERRIWTPQEAVRFLRYCHDTDPLIADLCELLIGTGMRKGEALALHWADVHLGEQVLYVRYTLSTINNSRLVITTPKTRSSKNWVAISPRVTTALQRRAAVTRGPSSDPSDPFTGLVFCRPDGRPLRPQTILDRFHRLSKKADVPRIALHDLRHLAATLTITAGIPLTVVSKTLRHSTLSTTANIYSHLTHQAAHDAVDAIDATLTQADRDTTRWHWPTWLRPPRDHPDEHHSPPKALYSPALNLTSPTASRPRASVRPPCDHHAGKRGKGRPRISAETASDLRKRWSGRQDLNLRPLDPQLVLRLPSIRQQFADLTEGAARDQMSYRAFLAELLMAECDDRARRRSERRIKAASFLRDKSLRAFDFEANPNIDPATVNTLAPVNGSRRESRSA